MDPKEKKHNLFEDLQLLADVTEKISTSRSGHKAIEGALARLNQVLLHYKELTSPPDTMAKPEAGDTQQQD